MEKRVDYLSSRVFCLPIAKNGHQKETDKKLMALALSEGQVALVSQGSVYELGGVSLIFVGVLKLCIYHPHVANAGIHQVVSAILLCT